MAASGDYRDHDGSSSRDIWVAHDSHRIRAEPALNITAFQNTVAREIALINR